MFDAEESYTRLRDLRRQIIAMKGEMVEGLTSPELENEKQSILINAMNKKTAELNA